MLLIKNCETCHQEFSRKTGYSYKYWNTQRFCSSKCRSIAIGKLLSIKFSQKINLVCQSCHISFSVSPCQSKQKYCSRKCQPRSVNVFGHCPNRAIVFRTCPNCEKVYSGSNNRYCSIQCKKQGVKIQRAAKAMKGEELKMAKRVYASNRRSKIIANGGSFTKEQWRLKLEYFGNRCYLCSKTVTEKTAHIEHRIPISKGGKSWVSNLAPSCASCNFKKNRKTEKEFREIYNLKSALTVARFHQPVEAMPAAHQ